MYHDAWERCFSNGLQWWKLSFMVLVTECGVYSMRYGLALNVRDTMWIWLMGCLQRRNRTLCRIEMESEA